MDIFYHKHWCWFLKPKYSFTLVGCLSFAINNTVLYLSLERYSLRSVYFRNATEWKIFLLTDYVKKEIQGSTPSMLNETVRLLNKLLEQQLHLISFDSEFPPEEEF